MSDRAGIRVNGRFYPIPTGYTLDEACMIESITGGMSLQAFAAALQQMENDTHPRVYKAFVWWCMHRLDGNIRPEDVGGLSPDDILSEGAEPADPKVSSEPAVSSTSSSAAANGSEDGESAMIPAASGSAGSGSATT